MISRVIIGWRLLAGFAAGLLLVGMESATAGLLLTADGLSDFSFDGARVVYYPKSLAAGVEPHGGFRLGSKGEGNDPGDFLYLIAEEGESRNGDGGFRVVRKLVSVEDSTIQGLINSTLSQMRVDNGAGPFDFLIKEERVSGGLVSQYGDSGVYVRGADLGETDGVNAGNTVANPLSARKAAGGAQIAGRSGLPPAIPAPGTGFLLLSVAVPLILLRRRG